MAHGHCPVHLEWALLLRRHRDNPRRGWSVDMTCWVPRPARGLVRTRGARSPGTVRLHTQHSIDRPKEPQGRFPAIRARALWAWELGDEWLGKRSSLDFTASLQLTPKCFETVTGRPPRHQKGTPSQLASCGTCLLPLAGITLVCLVKRTCHENLCLQAPGSRPRHPF